MMARFFETDAFMDVCRALRRYMVAQRRMLDRWADGDDAVKKELWQELHACEDGAWAAIRKAEGIDLGGEG